MKPSILIGSFVALLLVACASGPLIATPPAPNASPTKAGATAAPPLAATVAPTDAPAATEPAGQPDDARAAIGAALEALDRNGPYRMGIFAASDPDGPVFLEVVPPDRSHYMASVEGIRVEVINIGDTAYVLDPDGTWQVSTTTDSGSDAALLDPASLAALTDIEVLPPEIINGTATTVYSFVDPATPGVKVTLWVSVDEGRPVQMTTVAPDDSVLYAIAYDSGITVEAPAP